MLFFLASEVAFFGTLIMAYVYFLRQTTHGEPNPSQVFHLPLVLAASGEQGPGIFLISPDAGAQPGMRVK